MGTTNYRVILTTLGPVHIGTGRKYDKKDYFIQRGKTIIIDAAKFVSLLTPEQLASYQAFLQEGSGTGLQVFLERYGLFGKAEEAKAYQFDVELARARRGSYLHHDAYEFIKDVHGCPYVPGSSVKGMLRTAILTSIILKDRGTYSGLFDQRAARSKSKQKNACKEIEGRAFKLERPDPSDPQVVNDIMRYVSVSDSEQLSVNDLVFAKKYDKFSNLDDGGHKKAMGNISDKSYYRGNDLNIYRESLRPGTRISLSLSIDDRVHDYIRLDQAGLRAALEEFANLYQRCFLDFYDTGDSQSEGSSAGNAGNAGSTGDGRCRYIAQSGPLEGSRCRNRAVEGSDFCSTHQNSASSVAGQGKSSPSGKELVCYLGGGIDFASKTVINALFSDDYERVIEIAQILYSQFPTKADASLHGELIASVREAGFHPIPMEAKRSRDGKLIKGKEDHRHWRDSEFRVSPHTMKLGKIGNKPYPMGKCRIELEEI